MEHFTFPGNIDFAADDQGAFSCIIRERLLCFSGSYILSLTATAKIGPDTNSHKSVLTAARFWPQR